MTSGPPFPPHRRGPGRGLGKGRNRPGRGGNGGGGKEVTAGESFHARGIPQRGPAVEWRGSLAGARWPTG